MMISFPGTCKFLFHCSLVMLLALTPFLTTILTSPLSRDSRASKYKKAELHSKFSAFLPFLPLHRTDILPETESTLLTSII